MHRKEVSLGCLTRDLIRVQLTASYKEYVEYNRNSLKLQKFWLDVTAHYKLILHELSSVELMWFCESFFELFFEFSMDSLLTASPQHHLFHDKNIFNNHNKEFFYQLIKGMNYEPLNMKLYEISQLEKKNIIELSFSEVFDLFDKQIIMKKLWLLDEFAKLIVLIRPTDSNNDSERYYDEKNNSLESYSDDKYKFSSPINQNHLNERDNLTRFRRYNTVSESISRIGKTTSPSVGQDISTVREKSSSRSPYSIANLRLSPTLSFIPSPITPGLSPVDMTNILNIETRDCKRCRTVSVVPPNTFCTQCLLISLSNDEPINSNAQTRSDQVSRPTIEGCLESELDDKGVESTPDEPTHSSTSTSTTLIASSKGNHVTKPVTSRYRDDRSECDMKMNREKAQLSNFRRPSVPENKLKQYHAATNTIRRSSSKDSINRQRATSRSASPEVRSSRSRSLSKVTTLKPSSNPPSLSPQRSLTKSNAVDNSISLNDNSSNRSKADTTVVSEAVNLRRSKSDVFILRSPSLVQKETQALQSAAAVEARKRAISRIRQHKQQQEVLAEKSEQTKIRNFLDEQKRRLEKISIFKERQSLPTSLPSSNHNNDQPNESNLDGKAASKHVTFKLNSNHKVKSISNAKKYEEITDTQSCILKYEDGSQCEASHNVLAATVLQAVSMLTIRLLRARKLPKPLGPVAIYILVDWAHLGRSATQAVKGMSRQSTKNAEEQDLVYNCSLRFQSPFEGDGVIPPLLFSAYNRNASCADEWLSSACLPLTSSQLMKGGNFTIKLTGENPKEGGELDFYFVPLQPR